MANLYTDGVGGSIGDSLALCKPLMTSGNVWYVDSAIGVDSTGTAGQNRAKPLLTFAQALANASSDDIVVLLDGHTETRGNVITVNKRLTVIGEGSDSGVPTAQLINNSTSASLLSITATNVQFRNIKFPAGLQANTNPKVTTNSFKTCFTGCYFECGAFDTGTAFQLASGADHCELRDTTFISTATLRTAQPESAIKNAAAINDLIMSGVVLSGGTVGFSNYYACDLSTAAVSRIWAENISLLLGADMKLHASSTGYVNVQTNTQGGKVAW